MYDTSMNSINHSYDRFFKIISIINFFLILVVLSIIVRIGPALSYEFSIYDAYPWYFWVFILLAIMCGQLIIIGSAITQSGRSYWLFGLCAILISNVLLLFIPVIRGYYIYGSGDVLSHIGFMMDILQSSNIGWNIYPIDHILGISIHIICGLSLPDVTFIIPLFFSFFFIFSLYFVGKTIFHHKFELLIFVILSLILLWENNHLAFVPNAQALFLVPLLLYLAFKMYHGENTNKYNFLLLMICSLIVFYHPLVTIMVILMLCCMQIIQYIQEKYENRILKKVNYTYTIFFTIAVFSLWSAYLKMATNVIEPVILKMLGDVTTQSELDRKANSLSQVHLDPIYLLKLISNFYGKWILLGILTLFTIVLILKSIKNQKTKLDFFRGFSVMGYIGTLMLSIAMFAYNGSFGFGRVYGFANLFALLIIPTGVYLFLYNNSNDNILTKKKIIKLLGVLFIFFGIIYFSLFNLYFSPILKYPNQQVPRSDYIGMSTFFLYREDSLPVMELGATANRFYDAIYGVNAPRSNIYFNETKMTPPDHFGYQNETLLRNFIKNSKYLLMDDLGRDFYPHMFPEFTNNWRFVAQDFERLKSDPNVQQVYSNKNFEVFLLSHQQ